MRSPQPRPAKSSSPASWLAGRGGLGHPWVRGLIGPGFEAYARVLHPLGADSDRPTWASVAARNGRVLHASAQWEQISHPPPFTPDPYRPLGRGDRDPDWGALSEQALAALCSVLARHTDSDLPCYFGVWEGWGNLHPRSNSSVIQFARIGDPVEPIQYATPDWQLDMTGATFHLPARTYHLFEGELAQALQIGAWITDTWFALQSPNLMWPEDRSWLVATEIDFDSTLVGGTRLLIDDLLVSADLEVLPVDLDTPYQDTINV